MKGCFVCGRDHKAKDKHKRGEVIEAIKRLKEKHHMALLTITDLDAIQTMTQDDSETMEESSDDEVHWGEGDKIQEE